MAIIAITNRTDLLTELSKTRTTDDTITLAPGVYDEFVFPKSLTRPLTITAGNKANPPTMRGIYIGDSPSKNSFAHLSSAAFGSSVQQLTLDGLTFYAQRFTVLKNAAGTNVSAILDDGQGCGWRVCGTSHPAAPFVGYSENGNYVGLVLMSGCNGIVVKNCTFNGYAVQFQFTGAKNVLVSHCAFDEAHEDSLKANSNFNGLTIEYCTGTNFRPLTDALAVAGGWTNPEPPHSDWFQQTGSGSNLTIRRNFIREINGHTHCGLIGNNAVAGTMSNLVVENNETQTSHPSGWLIGNTTNLTCRYNKGTGVGTLIGGGPELTVADGSGAGTVTQGTVVITNNYFTRLRMAASGQPNSTQTNDPNTYPPGWTHIQKSKVAAGVEYVGPYGQPGVVVPVVPPALTAGQILLNQVDQDPALASTDIRRTFSVKVPQHMTLRFSTGTAAIATGTAINGGTSGATATVAGTPVVTSGAYSTSDAVGHIPVSNVTGTWQVAENIRTGTTTRAVSTKIPMSSPAFGAYQVRYIATGDDELAMTKVTTLGAAGEEIWRATSSNRSHLRYPGDSFLAPKFRYQITNTSEKSDLSTALIGDVLVPDIVGTFVPTNKIQFPLTKGMYIGDQSVMQAGVQGKNWNKPAAALVGAATATSLSPAQPNTPTAYGNGDFLLAFFYKPTAAGYTVPGGLWSEVFANTSANGQGIALLAGFATGANVTLGSVTSVTTPKVVTCSYRGVNITTEYYAATPSLNASAAGVTVPGITIPTNSDDNYRLLIWVANAGTSTFTTPTGYRVVTSIGGTGPITLFEKIDPVRTFAGLTVVMSASAQSAGMALALKLA